MDINDFKLDLKVNKPSFYEQLKTTGLKYSQAALMGADIYLSAIILLHEAKYTQPWQFDEMIIRLTAEVKDHLVKFNTPGNRH